MHRKAVIVFGLPGSGKSFFAARLARQLEAVYISSDIVRNKVLTDKTYTAIEKRNIYNVLEAEMMDALRSGQSVVVDGTFYKEDLRRAFSQSAKSEGASCTFIEIQAPEDLIRKRLDRKREHSDADFSVYLKVKDEFDVMMDDHLVIESSGNNIDEMMEKAVQYLNRDRENDQ